jgi:DMSO/TMAO reductase YedYZ heme-binding membrane subunit
MVTIQSFVNLVLPEKEELRALTLSIYAFIAMYSYQVAYRGHPSIAALSESLAGTGGLLIGWSFALTMVGYFFNFLDKELKYRKHIGLAGFWWALAYSITLLFRFPEKYGYGLLSHIGDIEVLLGLSAMAIFTVMAIISQAFWMRKLGQYWRPVLRLGYVAYFFLVVRSFFIEWDLWENWTGNLTLLPPPRLVLCVYALSIIIFRIIMQVLIWTKKKPQVLQQVPPPSTQLV